MAASHPPRNIDGLVKTIIITGAGSGIGRATTIKLASLGYQLAISDINISAVSETRDLCIAQGVNKNSTHCSKLDVSDTVAVAQHVETVFRDCGSIDGVFNCAGINPTYTEAVDVKDEYWNRLMDVNLKGTFNMTREAIPHMRPGSAFVNVSSICGLEPGAGFSVYCATKYAVIGFSKSVALEVGSKGIRVNIIAPGYIDTPTNASVVAGQDSIDQSAARTALKRLGRPEEIADVVAFLFSDESRYMTGSVVEIDGGMP